MVDRGWPTVYEGLGTTLEGAVQDAHSQIPIREGFDYVSCRVLEWGYQRGGFVDSKQFFARVVEDRSEFKSRSA